MKPPASPAVLRREVVRDLTAAVDPEYLVSLRRLVPTEAPLLGVRVGAIRDMVRAFAATHSALDLSGTCELMDALAAGRCREEMLFGIFLLARRKRQLGREHWDLVVRWVDAVENWETCDQLAKAVAAPILAGSPELISTLVRWAKGRSPWRRRFALATCAALNQGGYRHVETTLRVCAPVIGETDPVVVKAVGWALREASKHGEAEVFAFLREHRVRATRRVLREASAKLTEQHRKLLGVA